MGTLELLKKLKNFLPNNTAFKLLKDDLIFIDQGTFVIVKYDNMLEIFEKLQNNENFKVFYKDVLNELSDILLNTVYKNGGIIFNFSDMKLNIAFDSNIIEIEDEETTLRALNCIFQLFDRYSEFIEKINKQYDLDLVPSISAAIDMGKFIDVMVGNEKRKERLLLGNTIKNTVQMSYCAKKHEILITSDLFNIIKNNIHFGKRGEYFTVKSLKNEIITTELASDSYLNLKTSILKTFLPNYLFKELKCGHNYTFNDLKKGGAISLELSGLHTYAEEYMEKYPQIENLSDKKIYADEFFYGMNKLFNKVFKIAVNYDGAINNINYSKYGIRVLITFSFPFTHENDDKNRAICAEEISKITSLFKQFRFKTVYFSDLFFASIIGSSERETFLLSALKLKEVDNVIAAINEQKTHDINNIDSDAYSNDHKILEPKKKDLEYESPTLKGLNTKNVLLGRNKEIINLNKLFREGGKIITVIGEYGSGKTRLIGELITRMTNENFHIVHSKIEDRDNIIDLFKYIANKYSGIELLDSNDVIKSKFNIYIDKLLQYAPENEKERFSQKIFMLYKIMYNIDIEDSIYDSLSPKLRLQSLKEALSRFIICNYHYLSQGKEGVLFVFDDIDNLKHEEKELLQYVIQYSISHLVEKGNLRNTKQDVNKISFLITQHINSTLEFNRFLKPSTIVLSSLKKDIMKILLKNMAQGIEVPTEISKTLLKKSQGNPFYLKQYFDYIINSNMIKENDNKFEKTKHYKKNEIPSDIREIITTNILNLDSKYQRILQAASVIGVKFEIPILKRYFTDCDSDSISEIINECDDLNLIKKYHGLKNCYTFTHPLLSEMFYKLADCSDKIIWHKKVAVLLEDALDISKIANPNWLGYHYAKAEEKEKAKFYLQMAYDDAVEKNFIEAAYVNMNLLEQYTLDNNKKNDIDLKKIEILYKMGNVDKARKFANKLLVQYNRANDLENENKILTVFIDNTIELSPIPILKKLLTRKEEILDQLPKVTFKQKSYLYYTKALLDIRSGNENIALENLEKSLEYSKKTRDYKFRCKVQNLIGELHLNAFEFEKSLKIFTNTLKMAEKHNLLKMESILLGNLGKINYKLGKIENSIKYYADALKITSKLSLIVIEATHATQLGKIYLSIGNANSALYYLNQAIKVYRALNILKGISYSLADIGECNILIQNLIEAEKCFNKAKKIAKEINNSVAKTYTLLNYTRLQVLKRNYDEAEDNFKEAITIFRDKKMYKRTGITYYYLAEMFFKQIVEFEDDPFVKYKNKKINDLSNIKNALKYSLQYSVKSKNRLFIAKTYLLTGKLYGRRNQYNKSLKNLTEAFEILSNSDYKELAIEINMEFANIYKSKKDFDSAIKILKETIRSKNMNCSEEVIVLMQDEIASIRLLKKDKLVKA